MSLFGAALADFLAETLNVSVSDATDSLNSFISNDGSEFINKKNPPKSSTQKIVKEPIKNTKPAAKTSNKTSNNSSVKVPVNKPAEKHTCERIKRGQTDPCGKNATKSIGTGKQQKWFCGTDKGGCYQAELNAEAKKNIEKKAVGSNATKNKAPQSKSKVNVSKKTNEERKIISDNKSKSLVHDVIGKLNINKKTINGEVMYIERTKRLLFDYENKEFYGVLDDDNKTILPISDENVKWLEARNQYVRQDPNVKLQDKHKSRDKATPQKEKSKAEKATKNTKSTKVEVNVSEEDPESEDELGENVSEDQKDSNEDTSSSVSNEEVELPSDDEDESDDLEISDS